MYFRHKQRAFTLVELMVAIGIIMLMATIILAAVNIARENTREKKRVADLANIEFALTLYREKERNYPNFPAGTEIGVNGGVGSIDSIITQYNGNTYADPSSQNNVYEYWYDSSFTCYDTDQVVIYARTMEQSKNANFSSLCTHPSAGSDGAGVNSYVVVIGSRS